MYIEEVSVCPCKCHFLAHLLEVHGRSAVIVLDKHTNKTCANADSVPPAILHGTHSSTVVSACVSCLFTDAYIFYTILTQIPTHTCTHVNKHTGAHTHTCTHIHRHTDRHTDRQTDTHTDRQTHTHTHAHTQYLCFKPLVAVLWQLHCRLEVHLNCSIRGQPLVPLVQLLHLHTHPQAKQTSNNSRYGLLHHVTQLVGTLHV